MSRIMDKVVEIANKREESLKLSKVEVELNVSKDVKSYNKDINSFMKKADSLFNKLEKAFINYDKLQNESKETTSLAKSWEKGAKGVLTRAEKASKELGISPNEIEGYSSLDKQVKELNNTASLFKEFKSLR